MTKKKKKKQKIRKITYAVKKFELYFTSYR